MDLKDFSHTSGDWRNAIRLNTRRTYFVIFSFILIYTMLGLILDLYFTSSRYPFVSLTDILYGLLHLNPFPTITLILFMIAVAAVLITFAYHNRLMLLGTQYREITPETAKTTQELQLYNVIEEMKIAAGLHFMPKVYVMDADYMNAFASGYSEKSAMVAITQGLISKLDREELQAVMAHELSHIRHMDIKLTLMASVLANMTLIILDLLFRNMFYGNQERNDHNRSRNILFLLIILLRFVLPIITVLLVLYLSRSREYMADAGCVQLMRDNQPLASALLKIYNDHRNKSNQYSFQYGNTPHESIRREAYIFDPTEAGISVMESISDLFSTHPSIIRRLAALGFKLKP